MTTPDDDLAAFYEVPENRDPVSPKFRLPTIEPATIRRLGPLSLSYTRSRRRVSLRWPGHFVLTWASIRRPPGSTDD